MRRGLRTSLEKGHKKILVLTRFNLAAVVFFIVQIQITRHRERRAGGRGFSGARDPQYFLKL